MFRSNFKPKLSFSMKNLKKFEGFTLVEVLIYSLIFTVCSVFLVGVLTSITETQIRQTSLNEVNQQISFVSGQIQKAVMEASLIENKTGVASTTLVLRVADESIDRVLIYLDDEKIYLKKGEEASFPLTSEKVEVSHFNVTKLEHPGGTAIAQVDFTIAFKSERPRARVVKTWQGAISRISAATFDSSILPGTPELYDIGQDSAYWRHGFFSGNLRAGGRMGLGVPVPGSPTSLKIAEDIAISDSNYGLVLKSPGGTCFRLGISNAGAITTTTIACP